MGRLLTGRQLRTIFDHFCPFDQDNNLKSDDRQVTLLAANSNNWWLTRAIVQAAAWGDQSPVIVQFSHNSNRKIGGDPTAIFVPEGLGYHGNPVVNGARANADWIQMEAEAWDADFVAVSLDHFRVPKFKPDADYQRQAAPTNYSEEIDEAVAYLAELGLAEIAGEVDKATCQAYLNYLSSTEYHQFRSDFLDTVQVMSPAWGMIDTEGIAPVLDFVMTRDITRAVRTELANHDMMIEAELGATGTSGDQVEYQKMGEDELEQFARLAAAFIDYTGGEGIAYDIGMKHAAKEAEAFEPDCHKLETVQRTIIEQAGIYAPFAQHGGTGAAAVTRGLVGKTNVSTAFLVEGSQARHEHFSQHAEQVRAGDKNICGTDVETHVYLEAVYNSVIERFLTTGSYQRGPEVAGLLTD